MEQKNLIPFYLVNLKAFGDFVIASAALKQLQVANKPNLIAGYHVRELMHALDLGEHTRLIGDTRWQNVPAAFDVRKRGILVALNSMKTLRHYLSKVALKSILVFDHLGWRERWIAGRHQARGLPDAGNIYLAYVALFDEMGLACTPSRVSPATLRRALIIPGARQQARIIPATVMKEMAYLLSIRGITSQILLLDGENLSVPNDVQTVIIPRHFDALITAIRACDVIVSADSLASHLGEFFGIPIFVATPKPKEYWLPKSAYLYRAWAIFGDTAPFQSWLERFPRG
ncbi:MAG: hypothetical protein ORN21_00315 [Methylophilaceae bacterium]|nr:hypothetical protein [Methylophilaceae bacterium]